MTRKMWTVLVCALGCASSSVMVAAPACFTTLQSNPYLKVCFTEDGNIAMFETPAPGRDAIRVGHVGEGYAVCSTDVGNVPYATAWDSSTEEAGWGPSTVTPPSPGSFPVTIKRRTLDGRLELTQTYTRDTVQRAFTVVMTLKNISPQPQYNIQLTRYADLDIDGTSPLDFFAHSYASYFGWQPRMDGVVATGNRPYPVESAVQPAPEFFATRDQCSLAGAESPTVQGDWAGRITFRIGTLAAGASTKPIKVTYRPF